MEITSMFLAVENHNLDEVKELALKHGLDVLNEEGDPLLVYAVKMGEKNIVQWLLSSGANWYAKDAQGDMGLHWAVKSGSLELVQLFFSMNSFCVDKKGRDGFTALNYAVMLNYFDVAIYLIKEGSSIFIANNFGDAPVHKIDEEKEILQKFCAEVDHVFQAIDDDDLGALKEWVGKTSLKVLDYKEEPPLMCAAHWGHANLVSWLLEHGADMYFKNGFNDNAFHMAAMTGGFEVVKLFCEHGIDIDVRGGDDVTALHYAVIFSHDDIAKYLISQGASLDIRAMGRGAARDEIIRKKKEKFFGISER